MCQECQEIRNYSVRADYDPCSKALSYFLGAGEKEDFSFLWGNVPSVSASFWESFSEKPGRRKLADIKEEGSEFIYKVCGKCNELKPLSCFSFDKRTKDGHITICKKCIAAYEQWRTSPDFSPVWEEKLSSPGMKQCSMCRELKDVSCFSKNNKLKDGLSLYCRACIRSIQKNSILSKREKVESGVVGSKVCSSCLLNKDFSCFGKAVLGKEGLSSVCKECTSAKARSRAVGLNYSFDPNSTKECARCKAIKGALDFYKDRRCTDGLTSYCRECCNVLVRERKEKLNYSFDPESTKICCSCRITQSAFSFYKNPKSLDGLSSYCKTCTNKRHRDYFANNEAARLRRFVRSRFSSFLKKAGLENEVDKEAALDFMGCTPSELLVYLEERFFSNPRTNEEMNWANHSTLGWHIDHIISLSSVDLKDPRQLKRVCHFSNLRPLWGKENCSKQAKLPKNWDKEAWLREIENE